MKKISHIQLGEKVLIAGLYGEENYAINNKLGIVKELIFWGDHHKANYTAKIIYDGNDYIINYENIFKIDNFLIDKTEHSLIVGNPFIYYILKYTLSDIKAVVDENTQYTAIGRTEENYYSTFLISGLC